MQVRILSHAKSLYSSGSMNVVGQRLRASKVVFTRKSLCAFFCSAGGGWSVVRSGSEGDERVGIFKVTSEKLRLVPRPELKGVWVWS